MDEQQKRVILENMLWLCENTLEQLATSFYHDGYITQLEYDSLNNRRNRIEKNQSLFNCVIVKGYSFQALLENLHNSGNYNVAAFLENRLKDKLSFKRRMKGAALEKFLIPSSNFLYTETKHEEVIVDKLLKKGLITMDDSIVILEHPDPYNRNAELYKSLRLHCNYDDIVRILRETGNSKIADHLDGTPV